MKALKRKMLLPLSGLFLAGLTACGTIPARDAKVAVAENPIVAGAYETATKSSNNAPPPPQKISPSESVTVRAAEFSAALDWAKVSPRQSFLCWLYCCRKFR